MKNIILFFLLSTTLFAATKEETQQRENLLTLVSGDWIAQGLYTAAKFDIATHLYDGSKSIGELAELSNCHEQGLYRLLRMLTSVGVFKEEEDRIFSNSPTSTLLAKDHPQSLRSLILFYSAEISHSMRKLPECLVQGKTAFEIAYGQAHLPYFRDHPKSASYFNEGMQEKSKMVISSAMKSYDFGKFNTVYDIAGKSGDFLRALLTKYDQMRGLLFEAPESLQPLKKKLEYFGKRIAFVSGDFFEAIPKDGEAYILKSVIHDWNDEKAIKILTRCHAAMRSKAKLLILEPLMKTAQEKDYAKSMDVLMMAITGGKERTQADFERLLRHAGFKIDSITPTETEFSIIEATKI